MSETLLTPSAIKLYGRLVTDIKLTPTATPSLGGNAFLKAQLDQKDARLARIYGFSYEGHYYDLARPALFLVHGDGTPPAYPAHGRPDVDSAGVVSKEWEFSSSDPKNPDLRFWEYDKGDFSIRLDIESGPFEQILLAAALRGGPAAASGADLRASGADLRVSGADLRLKR